MQDRDRVRRFDFIEAAIVIILPELMTNIGKEVTPLDKLILEVKLEVKFKPLTKVIYSRKIQVNLIPEPMRFKIIVKDMSYFHKYGSI